MAVLVLAFTFGAWLASRDEGAVRGFSPEGAGQGATPGEASPTPVISPSVTPSGVGSIDSLPNRRSPLLIGAVRLSFRVPAGGWERFGDISINKSIVGPQGAEAMIFWTNAPDGNIAEPCADLLSPRDGRSATDLAVAIATTPGTELVTRPSDVTVGGRDAKHVVLVLRERVGCNPGVFFTWQDVNGGALWPRTPLGSTIRAWTVDVDGTLIFIGAVTNKLADADLARQVEQIVRSIRFEA